MAQEQNLGEFISLAEAQLYVSEFSKRNPDATKAYSASGEKLQQILAQDKCIGIRIYNGYDGTNQKNNLVILGIDEEYNDMDHGLIMDKFGMCPPNCSATGVLAQQ